jgi:DNA primase
MDPKDEIKQKMDLLELVGEYVQLKPAGPDRAKGLCPFHGEKTPSFHVSRERNHWHCFGCNEGGDCFDFVMKMEGMTFPEALLHLGKKTGVEVRRLPTKGSNDRVRMLQINELAEKFFRKVLLDAPGAGPARTYVEGRQIPPEISDRFGLGYAPDAWDTLSQFLVKRGFREQELVKAGVSMKRKSGSGVIDRFRNRIMIPLRDHHGNTVGFTGRVLAGDDKGPKYMNSPETPVYSKSALLYGLDLAKRAARDFGFVVITEGNLDVVASHKADMPSIVASSGTALTQQQLELLKRYTETIVFAFDADAAGFKAAKKGISMARGLEFDVRAILLPDEVKDPDELVQKDPAAWVAMVKASVPIMEFFIAHVIKGKDLTNIDDKRAVAGELLPAIGEIVSVVEREHWLQTVADLLRTPVDQLRTAIKPIKRTLAAKPEKKAPSTSVKLTRQDKARRLLFGYMIGSEDVFAKERERMTPVFGSEPQWGQLYNLAGLAYDSASQSAQKSFFARIREQLASHDPDGQLTALLDSSTFMVDETFHDLPPQQVLIQIDTLLSMFAGQAQKDARRRFAQEIRQAEQAGDTQKVKQLLEQLSHLT